MGNQEGKEQSNQQNVQNNSSLSQIPDSKKQLPINDKKQIAKKLIDANIKTKNTSNQKIQSRGPSALDQYKQKNRNSNRNSPQMNKNNHNTPSYRATPIPSSLSNARPGNPNPNSKETNFYDQDDNQFMPLIKLDSVGQIRLRISLAELVLQKNPKPQLRKKSSVYNSVLTWKKDARNIFTFILKQDKGYQLTMEIDLQGNTLNNKDQFWSALCPINIPLGTSVKVGQMTCVNWYCRLQEEQIESEDNLGPSLKNVDFKLSEETFGKWGQKVPKSFYDQNSNQVVKKVYQKVTPVKFSPYKQLSRYFDSKNIWRGSTFIEQTSKYYRSWIIQVTDHNSVTSISKQLHADFKNRQNFYTKTIFERQFGSQSESNQN